MADEYIKRKDALDALTADALERNLDSVMTDTASRYHRAAQRVVSIVPAADVRPVVLCKDCIHCQRLKRAVHGTEYCCEVTEMLICPESDYCSFSER